MFVWLSTVAQAHPHVEPGVDQEIVVWADPFKQWDQRWLVQTELRFPVAQSLGGVNRRVVAASILRVRAVLDCNKDAPRGNHRWNVSCRVDDVAFQALQEGRDRLGVGGAILAEWDAMFTGETIGLVVRDDRAILSTDLVSGPSGTPFERQSHEFLRQVAIKLVSPLQVELPDLVSIGETWFEPRSRLLEMPSSTAPFGISEVVHSLSDVDGHWVVQSQGRGAQRPGIDFSGTVDGTFMLRLDGVARFDQGDGMLVERVWQVGGFPTASSDPVRSPLLPRIRPYHAFGQLLLLDDSERPVLGPTRFLAPGEWDFEPTLAFATDVQG